MEIANARMKEVAGEEEKSGSLSAVPSRLSASGMTMEVDGEWRSGE
jgi:hypothetical protein